MAVKKLLDFKAGGTLSLGGYCNLPEGHWAATCHLRRMFTDDLIGQLAVTLGVYEEGIGTPIVLAATAAQTELWLPRISPAVQLPCWLDIRFAEPSSGIVQYTLTYYMNVIKPVTKVTP